MPIHKEVLRAARRIAAHRSDWTFTPAEIVFALPHLNARSVRTHVVSRCCVNAPVHHLHRWPYFKRVGRGRYQILLQYRRESESEKRAATAEVAGSYSRVAEARSTYAATDTREPPDIVHVLVSRDGEVYVAECLEVAVVTQGRTLDELIANLKEAVSLHLEGQTMPRLSVILDVPAVVDARKT